LPFVEGAASAADLATRLIAALSEPYVIDGTSSRIGASIGIAVSAGVGCSADHLLLQADRALYDAKHAGKNTFRFHRIVHDKNSMSVGRGGVGQTT
jgi:GGDEF domain-containing protein